MVQWVLHALIVPLPPVPDGHRHRGCANVVAGISLLHSSVGSAGSAAQQHGVEYPPFTSFIYTSTRATCKSPRVTPARDSKGCCGLCAHERYIIEIRLQILDCCQERQPHTRAWSMTCSPQSCHCSGLRGKPATHDDKSCLTEIDSIDTNLTLTPSLLFNFAREATA